MSLMYRLREIRIVGPTRRYLRIEPAMATKPDELLPTANDVMKKLAQAEAEEASKEAAKRAAAEAEIKGIARTAYKTIGTFR
jgi:hypothetical protein